jgi:hypothetical protein
VDRFRSARHRHLPVTHDRKTRQPQVCLAICSNRVLFWNTPPLRMTASIIDSNSIAACPTKLARCRQMPQAPSASSLRLHGEIHRHLGRNDRTCRRCIRWARVGSK